MILKPHLLLLALAASGLVHQLALAADDSSSYKLSGFGTLGAVVTNNDDAQFRSNVRQSVGANKSPDLGVDTRLGVQLNAQLNSMFSGVAQVLTSRRDGREDPQLEWLFGQARVTPWLDIRVGRMVLPVYMVSDSRNVGYASHWVRAPLEVYNNYLSSSFDGAQLQFRGELSGTNYTLQASTGKAKANLFDGPFKFDFKIPTLYSINLVAERGDWLLRAGQTKGEDVQVRFSGNGILVSPAVTDIFSGLGVQYDNGKLLVMSEYVTRRVTGGVRDTDAVYVTGGYRFGQWMPYATWSQFKPKNAISYGLNRDKTATAGVGVRWDVYKNVALKAQYESTEPSTQFTQANAAFNATQPKVKVLSLTADFVF